MVLTSKYVNDDCQVGAIGAWFSLMKMSDTCPRCIHFIFEKSLWWAQYNDPQEIYLCLKRSSLISHVFWAVHFLAATHSCKGIGKQTPKLENKWLSLQFNKSDIFYATNLSNNIIVFLLIALSNWVVVIPRNVQSPKNNTRHINSNHQREKKRNTC